MLAHATRSVVTRHRDVRRNTKSPMRRFGMPAIMSSIIAAIKVTATRA